MDKDKLAMELAAMSHEDMWGVITTALFSRSFNAEIELKLIDPFSRAADVIISTASRLSSMRSKLNESPSHDN